MAHQILPGSLEVVDGYVQAGVHTGPSEWQIENLRFVRGKLKDADPKQTTREFLSAVYDNSTGSLTHDDFAVSAP